MILGEAEKAELRNKPNLHRLVLEMSSDRGEEAGRDDAKTERMDSVLEGLRPHANLEELRLQCSRDNSKLPSWLEDSCFSKLTSLEILGSVIQREQNNLPGLGEPPALERLEIVNVGLKKVGRELYYGNLSNDVVGGGGREAFAKLEKLVLKEMSELEEWELTSEFDADEFRIKRIRNEALPNGGWEQLVALRELEIDACFELKSLPEGLTQLQSLRIRHLVVLTCLPDSLGQLESLESLEILDSKNLPNSLAQLESSEYFDDLVAWSSDGSWCKMHDLLHDLAELITKDETCIHLEIAFNYI
ncbi:hypothetical protein ACLOJK_041350 [Asimina triloba]